MARKQTATEIQVTFRHIDGAITEKTREYVQKRLRRIVGTLPNLRLATAAVTYEATGQTETKYVVQTTLTADRTVLRVEEKGSDPFSAIDRTHDPLDRRIRDWKDRVYYRRRHQAAMLKEPLAVEDEMLPAEVEENESSIVRLKSHETKPMFPEDAVEQVELLDHDFFFFLNGEASRHNVVYRRKAGGYGLTEPAPRGETVEMHAAEGE